MLLSPDNIRSIHPYELKILRSLEALMTRFDWVPLEDLVRFTKFSTNEVMYRLRRLMDKDLIKYAEISYPGYALLFNGYDTLAVSHLTRKGVISALGSLIAEGKESRIYEAMGTGPVILKIHRLGQRSFHTVKRNRGFLPDKGHCPWIFASHLSAEQEYLALCTLCKTTSVPVPLIMNRNIVAMTYVPGVNLNTISLEEPEHILDIILDQVRAVYKLGYIHGDLSEYNIMTDGDRIWIIDWPQWIQPDHENASEILNHDIVTVLNFFEKKYKIIKDPEGIQSWVTGR